MQCECRSNCRATTCVSEYDCACLLVCCMYVMRAGGEIGQQTCVWSKYSAKVIPVPNHPWPMCSYSNFLEIQNRSTSNSTSAPYQCPAGQYSVTCHQPPLQNFPHILLLTFLTHIPLQNPPSCGVSKVCRRV